MFKGTLRDVLFLCLCAMVHVGFRYRKRRLLPLPPGPHRWPIVGNAFMMPLTHIHVFYKQLGMRFGETLVYARV
jgi:hypothetical protein